MALVMTDVYKAADMRREVLIYLFNLSSGSSSKPKYNITSYVAHILSFVYEQAAHQLQICGLQDFVAPYKET
jgi:hypothetical protein